MLMIRVDFENLHSQMQHQPSISYETHSPPTLRFLNYGHLSIILDKNGELCKELWAAKLPHLFRKKILLFMRFFAAQLTY